MTEVGSAPGPPGPPVLGSTEVASAAPIGGSTLVMPFGSYAPIGDAAAARPGSTWVGSAAAPPAVSGTGAGEGSGASSAPTPRAASTSAGALCTPMPEATTRSPRARFSALGRSFGSLRRQRSMTIQSGSGTFGGRCGSSLRWRWSTSRAVPPANGGRPVTSS